MFNIIVEWEGAVIDVRPRFWAAHQQAIAGTGFQGPGPDEFWRLVRTGAPDSAFVPLGKPHHVNTYAKARNEAMNSSELMALDEAQPGAALNLKALKAMGGSHLVTLSSNRDGINATLNRLDLWMYFDQKRALPADRDRRVDELRKLAEGHRCSVAIVATAPMAYAAGEAGFRLVGVKSGPTVPKLLRQVGVDAFYEGLDDLTDALARRDPELQRIGVY